MVPGNERPISPKFARTQPMDMTLQERIDNYHKVTGFPKSLFLGGDGRIAGIWIMGNCYQVKSKFYGGYPHGYLRRVKALFPDRENVLHLFSGKVDTAVFPGITVDINENLKPDIVDDAHTLTKVPVETFDLVLADPAYSSEDTEHYGTPMVNRSVVLRALGERLAKGCFVVWLDQVLPMYKKTCFSTDAHIGMVKSTNHRFRIITVFKKL